MKSSIFRLPAFLAVAAVSAFAFAMPVSAKDNQGHDHDHGRKGKDKRHGHGGQSSHGEQSHHQQIRMLFCGSHKHHHTHVWHGRDHRDYTCPGHK